MGHVKTSNLNDEQLQTEFVKKFEIIRNTASRLNILGEEMASRNIIGKYVRVYYPNIWNHGDVVET